MALIPVSRSRQRSSPGSVRVVVAPKRGRWGWAVWRARAVGDRPIIMSGPMVRALLAGTKHQTRRILKPEPRLDHFASEQLEGFELRGFEAVEQPDGRHLVYRPMWRAGDRLWVREAHALLPRTAYRGSIGTGTIEQREHPTDGYTAAVFREGFDRSGPPLWRPSIHMPRWASRLTLTVTDVRVERLNEISEVDAIAEGMREPSLRDLGGDLSQAAWSERQMFQRLWCHLHGPDAWKANPFVVAISFTATPANIDSLPEPPHAG